MVCILENRFRVFKPFHTGKTGEWDSIALLQGNAFVNEGEQTYMWYSHWDCEGQFRSQEIGLATLRRDGFGYLSRQLDGSPGHLLTRTLTHLNPSLFVNADLS